MPQTIVNHPPMKGVTDLIMTEATLVLVTEQVEAATGKKNPGEQESPTAQDQAAIAEIILPAKEEVITALTAPQETGRGMIIREDLMITAADLREIRAVIRRTETGHPETGTELPGMGIGLPETETELPVMETELPETETDLNREVITGSQGKNQNSGMTGPKPRSKSLSNLKRPRLK